MNNPAHAKVEAQQLVVWWAELTAGGVLAAPLKKMVTRPDWSRLDRQSAAKPSPARSGNIDAVPT
jgi:hypothetical protein